MKQNTKKSHFIDPHTAEEPNGVDGCCSESSKTLDQFLKTPVSALGFARTLVRLSKNTKKIPWMTRTLIDVLKDAKKLSIIGGVSALWGVSEHHKKSWYVSLTSSYVDV